MTDLQNKIVFLENKINKLINLIGTKTDAEELEDEIDDIKKLENLKKNIPINEDEEKEKIKKQTLSYVITLMRRRKAQLLENNDELRTYFKTIKENKYMLDNFCNYANTALNIRDKARLIMHIKDDLVGMNLSLKKLEIFEENFDKLKKMSVNNKQISEKSLKKLKVLIERSELQKREINKILEIYREMVEYINEKIIQRHMQ